MMQWGNSSAKMEDTLQRSFYKPRLGNDVWWWVELKTDHHFTILSLPTPFLHLIFAIGYLCFGKAKRSLHDLFARFNIAGVPTKDQTAMTTARIPTIWSKPGVVLKATVWQGPNIWVYLDWTALNVPRLIQPLTTLEHKKQARWADHLPALS